MGGNHGTIGGKSVVDEALTGLVTKAVLTALNGVEHKEIVQKMLRNLPSLAQLALDPVVLQTAISAMPDFGHPEIAHMVKDVLVQSAHAIEDMAHDAKSASLSPEEKIKAGFADGIRLAGEQKYAVQGRCFHRLDCGELPAPRQQGGKKGEPKQVRNDFRELPLAEVIRQRYFPCQFCIGGATDAKHLLRTEAPAPRKREPMEIIGSCTDAAASTTFEKLIAAVSPEDKVRIWDALKHLSSDAEFVGTMRIAAMLQPHEYPAFVEQLGTLLQQDDGTKADALGFLGQIGGVIGNSGAAALALAKDVWNAKATPAASKKPSKKEDGDEEDDDDEPLEIGLIRALTF